METLGLTCVRPLASGREDDTVHQVVQLRDVHRLQNSVFGRHSNEKFEIKIGEYNLKMEK